MRPVAATLKSAVQVAVTAFHRSALRRPLPDRIAIYFHELEAHQQPAFVDGIRAIVSLGYRAVDAAGYVAGRPGEKLLFVSFDDNYRSWFEARPAFDAAGIRATFYTNTAPFRDRSDSRVRADFFERIAFRGEQVTLSTTELAQLAADGHTIGCHSHAHHDLARLPREAWDREIRASKVILEDIVGRAVTDFAWPYGMRRYFNPTLDAYCRGLGFRTVAAAIPAMLHAPVAPGTILHRSGWRFGASVSANIADLAVDGRLFEAWTGRSAIG